MLNLLKQKTKVILDTNFLLLPGEFGVDIFTEIKRISTEPIEICILDKTMQELKLMIETKGQKKEGFNAKLGYIMTKQKNLKTLTSSKHNYADDALVEIVSKNPKKTIIATQDKELQKRIQNKKGRIITLKQNKYLQLR
ncbi:hypothetical protein K9L97_00280 [Candidatus Woesearchaeota archaeon]|nr:hypothetical protein [Candidatus Woesearchaeota archaeon]